MNQSQLKAHYDSMWEKSLQKFRKQKFEVDELIDSVYDDRYGMTLLARPSIAVNENIERVLNEIKKHEPKQYFYPKTDIHLTILSIISCYSGFSLEQLNHHPYKEIIGEVLESIEPFEIHFKGLTASPSCIMIQGFPKNNQLKKLRNTLRSKFKNSELQHSIDERYTLQTAHLTVIRFRKPVQDATQLIYAIERFRDHDFGRDVINELELVGNNWYQQKKKVQRIQKFKLS